MTVNEARTTYTRISEIISDMILNYGVNELDETVMQLRSAGNRLAREYGFEMMVIGNDEEDYE